MIARLLRWEWSHWATRREIRTALIALPLATLLWAWLLGFGMRSDVVPALLSGGDATGFALAYRSARALQVVLSLLLLLWSSAAIAGELESGVLRVVLLRCDRRSLLLAKALHLFLVGAALSLAILLLAWVVGALQFGLEPVELGAITVHSRVGLLASGMTAFALTLLPAAALIALGLCIGTLTGSARAATTASLFAVAALWALAQVEPVASLSFLRFAGQPFVVAIAHAEGYRDRSHLEGLSSLLLSCLACCILCLALASWRFTRKDLT